MNKTKDQQAQEYAKQIQKGFIHHRLVTEELAFEDIEAAWLDGYTACEQSMWRSVEEELPEDDRLVLAHFSDVDSELSYATAYYRDGAWQTPDDWYYDCKINFWMPIPSLSDTNTEKKCGLATSNK